MDTLQNSLKGYGSVYSFAAIVGAIIAGYVLVMFGVPVFFPYTTYNYNLCNLTHHTVTLIAS